jgi:hypothetical protein
VSVRASSAQVHVDSERPTSSGKLRPREQLATALLRPPLRDRVAPSLRGPLDGSTLGGEVLGTRREIGSDGHSPFTVTAPEKRSPTRSSSGASRARTSSSSTTGASLP